MTETHRFGRRLRRGRWTARDAGDLQRVIARAAESEAQWQGNYEIGRASCRERV